MAKAKNPNNQGVIHRDVNPALRAAQAMQLRAKRFTYEQIATECGYASSGSCRNAIMRELDRRVVEGVDRLRREELLTLDILHGECWELAMDRENDKRLFAVDRLLAISTQRMKLLGLEKSTVPMPKTVVREAPAGYFGQPLEGAKP